MQQTKKVFVIFIFSTGLEGKNTPQRSSEVHPAICVVHKKSVSLRRF